MSALARYITIYTGADPGFQVRWGGGGGGAPSGGRRENFWGISSSNNKTLNARLLARVITGSHYT